jgi:hypothetical protein
MLYMVRCFAFIKGWITRTDRNWGHIENPPILIKGRNIHLWKALAHV